ncbi:GNAT family N-acetyltransferase [Saccharibacillus sp. JS10]|uniref:GNAT family N-acetyltransferase n=1 Tax=Saccharibacillus sp. JS10 TaxID=2950552 RepID=UPI00210AD1EE|nr:GNAT family N-acetyltransferase [Saccharibacillus sp. JS10]MCQ4085409.1 N-acetyltransferase [Saccharibacillus sp. JS10]
MGMLKTIKNSMNDTKQALDGIKASMDGLKTEMDTLKTSMGQVQEQMKDKPATFKASLSYLKLGVGDLKSEVNTIKQGIAQYKDAGKDREPAASIVAGAEFVREDSGFKLVRGTEVIGEITYANGAEPDVWIANHTYVDPKYRGASVAKLLLDRLVGEARVQEKQIFPACSYVRAQFKRHASYQDVWHQY